MKAEYTELYTFIKYKGLDIAKLARALGISRKQTSFYVHNTSRLTVDMINKIAVILEVEPVTIFSKLK